MIGLSILTIHPESFHSVKGQMDPPSSERLSKLYHVPKDKFGDVDSLNGNLRFSSSGHDGSDALLARCDDQVSTGCLNLGNLLPGQRSRELWIDHLTNPPTTALFASLT